MTIISRRKFEDSKEGKVVYSCIPALESQRQEDLEVILG